MSKKKFPATLWVSYDNGGECFLADETLESKDDGMDVAVYELVQIKTMRVIHELVKKTRKR